jgi:hypothetical protein
MPVKPIKDFPQSFALVLFKPSGPFHLTGNREDSRRHSSLIIQGVRNKSNKHKTLLSIEKVRRLFLKSVRSRQFSRRLLNSLSRAEAFP